MKKSFEKWSQEIHELAVEKGWWDDGGRKPDEVMALIHSELSEALEEYRAGRPLLYYVTEAIQRDGKVIPEMRTDFGDGNYDGQKPEGQAVELLDAVIRILDYFGRTGITQPYPPVVAWKPDSLPSFIASMHRLVASQNEADLMLCLTSIMGWVEASGIDPEHVMEIKHAFNKSRPYRHNKLC